MRIIVNIVLIIIGLLLSVSACHQKDSRINIAGSTTVLPIVQAAAETYCDKNPTIDISVRGGGSGVGIKSALEKSVDIGSSSRKINEREKQILQKDSGSIIETAIARDAISLVVNVNNSVNQLSIGQLKDIFSGKIVNWSQLGGENLDIVVISRDVSSGSFEVFNEVVLDNSKVVKGAMMLNSNNAVSTNVGYTPGAIGYVGLGFLHRNLNVVAIDGVFPSKQNVHNNSYTLSRYLYMYTSDTPRQLALNFIDFILSKPGQEIVEEQGYVRVK